MGIATAAMALPVTVPQAIAFALLAMMMVLFAWNRLRFDLVALLGLVVAVAAGIVPLKDAFVGFSDQVVMLVASALVISAGVGKSGLIGRAIRRIEPLMGSVSRQVFVLTFGVTLMSMLMKNIGALAIFLPIAVQVARRSGTPLSRLLMPMSFGSLIGGVVTLVGTSPNILVSRVRETELGQPFAMFDFAPVGLGIVAAGLLFLAVGWRLLPADRKGPGHTTDSFSVEPYLAEAVVPEGSAFVGRTVAELEALGDGDVTVTAIVRERTNRYVPAGHWWLLAGDVLVLQGDAPALQLVLEESGLALHDKNVSEAEKPSTDLGIVEAVIGQNSRLIGRSAADLRLRDRFGASLVAVSRRGHRIRTHLRHAKLRAGDVLALQGGLAALPEILRELDCLPLVDRATGLGRPRQEYLPLAVLASAMLAVAFNLVPVVAAFFAAAVVIVLTGILTIEEAYDAIDLPILVLLACLIPISDAVRNTGGAELVAGNLVTLAHALPPVGAVTLLLVTAMAVTPFLNNAATVLIMAPVAVSLAKGLGMQPDPLLMAVAIGAACDFLTPIGHQCNTLVMGPGGYRFGDYWRLGLPLSLIVLVVATLLIPIVWPLR